MRRGLFAVYKPPGITSAEVTNRLKQTLLSQEKQGRHSSTNEIFKVGHGGTLDKFAEGVLVIGIGKDCKRLGKLQNGSQKSYEVIGHLGVTTDTLDCDGMETATKDWKHVTVDVVEHVLQGFHGNIIQSAPLYSALKYNGKKLSNYAREAKALGRGVVIPSKLRHVTIHSLKLLDFNPPTLSMAVTCSSGTYIRSLVRDIAEKLDTVGYVAHLCRSAVGPFTLEQAIWPNKEGNWNLESIKAAALQQKCYL